MIQLANFAQSILTVDINTGATTVTVQDGSVFPSSGDFYVVIGNEILKVTARTVNDLTVTRGQEGSVATDHKIGDYVTLSITKAVIEGLFADYAIRTTLGSRPAAGKQGRIWFEDGGTGIAYDDGSSWHSY